MTKADNTDTAFAFMTGGAMSIVAYLIGGVDNLSVALMIFMATDYVTGIMSGFYNKNLDSHRAYKGLAKKSGMIAFVIVANQVDIITGNSNHFLRDAMIMFLIGTEGLSIIENVGRMGMAPPDWIVDSMKKLNGSEKKGGNDNNGDQKQI